MYTISTSEHHWPMDMSVRSGTPVICMDMAPPERREYILESSGVNPSLADLTLMISSQRITMMSER